MGASHGDGEQDGVAGWTFCRALPAAEETAESAVAEVEQSVGFLKTMCARHSSESSCVAKGCAWDNGRCDPRKTEFKCKESTIASGHGFVVHRLNFEDCKKKMERQGLSFVYYGGSRH